jgi:8-oxo-dGTP pyrophosphatase MutT (NUDIX family)
MENFCHGLDQGKARRLISNISPPEKALGAWVAGIRETFEEVGLLLAYEKNGSLISLEAKERAEIFKRYRLLLNEGKIKLKEVLENEGLTMATDRLYYFSHWVTPEPLPIRYDVRFFVSEAPENQEPLHDGFELVEHRWIKPQDAVYEYEHQNFNLVLPTITTLRELCRFKTVGEVIRSTEGRDIPRILTKMAQKGEQRVEMMPDGSAWGPSPI